MTDWKPILPQNFYELIPIGISAISRWFERSEHHRKTNYSIIVDPEGVTDDGAVPLTGSKPQLNVGVRRWRSAYLRLIAEIPIGIR